MHRKQCNTGGEGVTSNVKAAGAVSVIVGVILLIVVFSSMSSGSAGAVEYGIDGTVCRICCMHACMPDFARHMHAGRHLFPTHANPHWTLILAGGTMLMLPRVCPSLLGS